LVVTQIGVIIRLRLRKVKAFRLARMFPHAAFLCYNSAGYRGVSAAGAASYPAQPTLRRDDMSDQQVEPIERVRNKARSLDSTLDSVRTKASLRTIFDTLEDVDSKLSALPGKLAQVRARGYVFKNYLEADADAVKYEWPSTRPRVQNDADYQRRQLTQQMDEIQARFASARLLIDQDATQAESALAAVEAAAQALDKSAGSAISTLQGMYNSSQSRLSKVEADIRAVDNVLSQVDQASFKLYPNENVVDVMEAQWMTDQKGGPKGLLFCTDHRLIFEQKEDVAVKKVLFVVTEKKKVQQVAMEAPIGAVEQVKESESGALLFRKDHLDLTFGPQSKVRSAHFVLKGDSAAWQRLINRINAGELAKERVKTEDEPKPTEAPKQLPAQCPACGARFTQEIVRGMTSVKCQFCGTVTRL
jgi:hypothetical protein